MTTLTQHTCGTDRAPGPASSGRSEQTAEKSEFRVVPHQSGFAPGVDPDQIKEILYEMELEDYRRKGVL